MNFTCQSNRIDGVNCYIYENVKTNTKSPQNIEIFLIIMSYHHFHEPSKLLCSSNFVGLNYTLSLDHPFVPMHVHWFEYIMRVSVFLSSMSNAPNHTAIHQQTQFSWDYSQNRFHKTLAFSLLASKWIHSLHILCLPNKKQWSSAREKSIKKMLPL